MVPIYASLQVTDKMVEFVDIMPTLVEAAGFPPVDKCPVYSRNVSFCRCEPNKIIHRIE